MTPNRFKPMLDRASLVAAIKHCTTAQALKTIHAHLIRTRLDQNTFLAGNLLESAALTVPGLLPYAHYIFSGTNCPNLFMWNTIIRGYSFSDSPVKALKLYKEMLLSGISPNTFTLGFIFKALSKLLSLEQGEVFHSHILKMGLNFETPVVNSLVKLYLDSGYTDYARKLFDEMSTRDAASWSTLISWYVQQGCELRALDLFRQMQIEGVEIDEFVLASVVKICGNLGALNLGKWVHSYINKLGVKVDVILGTSLVDMYAKCGILDDAFKVFQGLYKRDVMAWSAMIGGYAIHGYGEKALELFNGMKKASVRPNSLTFTSVLCACSHSGLVDEGCRYFDNMQFKYGIVPQIEHYGCMVDLFCRAGLVVQAHEFIRKMPIEPNVVLWRALLGACRTHGFIELSENISRDILELEPRGGDNYVLVSNVYASAGRWSNVSKVRTLMKEKRVKKQHGWSSIEVNFVVHQFIMGDESHPEKNEIYQMLDEMARKLSKQGHAATTMDVLHDIQAEEKEHALGVHSERLAIAYGLLRVPKDLPIRIVKNLRVCRDCHSVIKLLCGIYKREIIVRDRVRFHHFRESKCSCNDYW